MENLKERVKSYFSGLQEIVVNFLIDIKGYLTVKSFAYLYAIYTVIFILVMYFKSDDLAIGLCFSEPCLSKLSEKFSTFISLTQGIITTLAIVIAARSLKLSQDSFEQSKANNQFNNHISNKKFFNEFIVSEIKELTYVNRSALDVNKYYHFMFPNSSQGTFLLNERYEAALLSLKKYLIQTSNASKKATAFDFKKHQARVSKALREFGFDLVNLPRRDFNLVEQEVFQLIDSVTILMTSCDKAYLLGEVDIHYR